MMFSNLKLRAFYAVLLVLLGYFRLVYLPEAELVILLGSGHDVASGKLDSISNLGLWLSIFYTPSIIRAGCRQLSQGYTRAFYGPI